MEFKSNIFRSEHRQAMTTAGKVVLIIALFALIAVLLEGMIYLQGNIFSGVRSYVRGEGLWAKAQKDAIIYLYQYSYTGSEAAYQAYHQAIQVNIGDRNARLAMQTDPPDLNAAATGFLQGGNDPQDIDSLIWFYRNFNRVSYMHDAVNIWEDADTKIQELIATASAMHQVMQMPDDQDRTQRIETLRGDLHRLNQDLVKLENRFSVTLGIGARWVRSVTWWASLSLLGIFLVIAMFISRQIIRGITTAERRLMTSESRFRSLMDSNTIGIVTWNSAGTLQDANDCFLDMLGYARRDLRNGNLNWHGLGSGNPEQQERRAIGQLKKMGRCDPYEKSLRHKRGNSVPVYLGASLIDDADGDTIAYVMDLSERKKADQQLRLAATVFAASNDGVLITDPDMLVISANRALCRMTGYQEPELLGRPPRVLQTLFNTEELYREMHGSLEQNGHWQSDVVERIKNGSLLPMRVSISSVTNEKQRITHYVAIISDITERKAQEDQLRHIAHHDTLTGLPNRILFNDRIEQSLKRARRNDSKFAVLFFDLNNFKPVNDKYGHDIGDKLLQTVAGRLIRNVRGTDTVTRLGGDEFVMLLEDVEDQAMVDQILDKTFAAVCEPCTIDGHDIRIGVSVGVSIYPEDGSTARALLHHADIAMYDMKNNERKKA